jgi:hypothetical protein
MPLNAGEVRFTDPEKTPLVFPSVEGQYAITKFHAEIVDDSGKSVTLDEVYLHHWLVFNSVGNDGLCGGYLGYSFGVGAESRGTPVEYPAGYGLLVDGNESWSANIHIFRTQGLKVGTNSSQALKECIECQYAPEGKGGSCTKEASGSFQCCMSGTHCPTDGSITDTKNYYLSYTVEYTTDLTAVKPVHVYVLDASNCMIEYNIEENNAQPLRATEYSWDSQVDGEVVFGVGHLHNGGVNITLSRNGVEVCTTVPVYGTEEGKAGNEKGYLVGAPPCIKKGETNTDSVHVEAGDTLTVRSLYWVGSGVDPTGSKLPGGFHGGVMSLFYLGVDATSLRDASGHQVNPKAVTWTPSLRKATVVV